MPAQPGVCLFPHAPGPGPTRWPAVLAVVRERLLTPVGLRSLAPGSRDYKEIFWRPPLPRRRLSSGHGVGLADRAVCRRVAARLSGEAAAPGGSWRASCSMSARPASAPSAKCSTPNSPHAAGLRGAGLERGRSTAGMAAYGPTGPVKRGLLYLADGLRPISSALGGTVRSSGPQGNGNLLRPLPGCWFDGWPEGFSDDGGATPCRGVACWAAVGFDDLTSC